MLPASAAPASQGGGRMMGGDDDDGDTIVETQEISSENLFHIKRHPVVDSVKQSSK